MKTTLSLLLALSFLSTGCAVLAPAKPTGKSKAALESSARDCAPHQYWDGQICRHKGKGKGARKHDG